ncbi:response regulator [Caenimonas sp. SL110]|uniref:response regulator n=1 Tax=Caenimonas sp. SL110 TaxID=1450524 RepID=UPI0006547C6F|nr:response regulator [Caenimonas sp. SL110]
MNRKILLIEDNEQNRYLVTFLLQARGWEVVHAGDGPAGLELARQVAPAVVLLDIQLPGMDGYEVVRALRAIAALSHTPVVAVTSYAMPGDRERCMASGCTGYLEKPIDPLTFVDSVESFVLPQPAGAGP